VDADLQELRRAVEAHPGDVTLTQRLEQALRRAGKEDEQRARYRIKFLCARRFEDLTPTPDPQVRLCDQCKRSVTYLRTPAELRGHVARGECTALPQALLPQAFAALAEDPSQHSAPAPRPCVVESALRFVELEGLAVEREDLERFSGTFARTLRLLPLGVSEGKLAVGHAWALSDAELRALKVACQPDALELVRVDPLLLQARIEEHYGSEDQVLLGDFAFEHV